MWHARRAGPALIVCFVLAAGCAALQTAPATVDDDSRLNRIFSRFEHERHDDALKAAGWQCHDCHVVGAVIDGEDDETLDVELDRRLLRPPAKTCHSCHERAEATELATATRCRLCHEGEDLPLPESHSASWVVQHQREAMIHPESCYDCHQGHRCVQCHFIRDQISHDVHDGAWLSVHGIAARADPVSCDRCHEGQSCQDCHTSPLGRDGW